MLDVSLILLFLPILTLILILVSIFVRYKLGTPVFFKQIRLGLNNEKFEIVKFRTMSADVDESGELLPDQLRITRFGNFLRSSSLDELPGLLNVFKGDMSLVGPRPLLVEYFPLYTMEQLRRHEVRPGITGWAQVNGRNSISWEEKFKLDVWYVDNRSLWLDAKILFLTIKKVLSKDGVWVDKEKFMPRFDSKGE